MGGTEERTHFLELKRSEFKPRICIFTSCAIIYRLLNLSEALFPHLQIVVRIPEWRVAEPGPQWHVLGT